ncbi:MAG: hypothetical protein V3V96_15380 [Acidiferrobacterales bacterium]
MKIILIDPLTGKHVYTGNSKNTKITRLIADGMVAVDIEPPSEFHIWNGIKWILDQTAKDADIYRRTPAGVLKRQMRRNVFVKALLAREVRQRRARGETNLALKDVQRELLNELSDHG